VLLSIPPKVAQAINQPSAETMKPAPVQRIGSGDPVLVDGQFWLSKLMQVDIWWLWDLDISATLLTVDDFFFGGGLFSTCGTCVREGVSSLTGTLRLKLFLHPVTGTSWTWNELTNLVICKKYLHFQWTQGGWWPYPRWRLLDGLWSTARDRQMGVYGGGQARGRWQT